MVGGARHTITSVADSGEPMMPAANARAFVHQCGIIVRDNVPISIQEWNKLKKDEGASYVSDRLKDWLWNKLISYFTLPVLQTESETEKLSLKVKEWALKKMATQFNKFKNKLYQEYVANGEKEPEEWTGPLLKQRQHWPQFLAMKKSTVFKKRSETNKKNASKKKIHHTMGTGGYRSCAPKWQAIEDEMRSQGVVPETDEWETRWRNYVLGHGAGYNMETGELIQKKEQIEKPLKALKTTIKEAQEGRFKADRENDELTKALENPEHTGRT